MNKPYVKQFNEIGECINPITAETPYLHRFRSVRGMSKRPYLNFTNGTSMKAKYIVNKAGQLILIPVGNNRANTSSRTGVNSRNRIRG